MKKKLIGAIGFASMALIIVIIVVVAVVSVVAAPISIVSSMFAQMGNILYGSSPESNDLKDVLTLSLQSAEVQSEISTHWGSVVNQDKDVGIPLNYIVITQFLSGVEYHELTDTLKKEIVDATKNKHTRIVVDEEGEETALVYYTVASEKEFASRIKQIEPFKSKLEGVGSNVLASYLVEITDIYHHPSLPVEFIENHQGFIYPLPKIAYVTAEYGWYDPFNTGTLSRHRGIDLAYAGDINTCGVPIYSVSDGTVSVRNNNREDERGFFITIKSGQYEFQYYHLAAASGQKVGDTVSKGTFLGVIGNTGKSTACHLHLGTMVNGVYHNPRLIINFDNPIVYEN